MTARGAHPVSGCGLYRRKKASAPYYWFVLYVQVYKCKVEHHGGALQGYSRPLCRRQKRVDNGPGTELS